MNMSSPEAVAARAVAVVTLERLIRDRTAWIVWSVTGVALILVIGSLASDGLGAVVLALLAVVAGAIAATLFAVRALVLRLLRRVAGGRDFARARPVIERHMADVERAGAVTSLDPLSVARLLWLARRPADLRTHVQQMAGTVARAIPSVVADVRSELAPGERRSA